MAQLASTQLSSLLPQTYGNECLIDCQNIRVAYYGLCDSACYPNSPMNDKGDWSSRQPVCALGLTWRNSAEAQYSGHPPECQTMGVCFYGVRDGEDLTYLSTSGTPSPSTLHRMQGGKDDHERVVIDWKPGDCTISGGSSFSQTLYPPIRQAWKKRRQTPPSPTRKTLPLTTARH